MEKGDELDDLFKKGLANRTNQQLYDESDWAAMEKLLDKRGKRGDVIYWMPAAGVAAALLLLFLGWWLYHPRVIKNNEDQQVFVIKHLNENTGIRGGAVRQTTDSSEQKKQAPANYATSPVHPGTSIGAGRSLPHLPVAAAAKLPVRATANVFAQNTNGKKVVSKDKKDLGQADVKKGNSARALLVNNAAVPGNKKDIGQADVKKGNDNPTLVANNVLVSNKKDIGQSDGKKDNDNANSRAANTAKTKVKVSSAFSGANRAILSLTAVASSDMNGTSPLNGGRMGGNFGAVFSVASGKWTFSTGGMYSIKPYQESFDNYHTAYVFQTDPATVGANCRMIDIPLNVNYQVYNKGVNKFTVGTGLSSYIILREDYTFNYGGQYAYGPASYSVVNRNRNIMSVLNLDATYERRINSKFGVILQPYIKLPFSNVGESQVKLQSTGIAVGLSWNLNSLKKPD